MHPVLLLLNARFPKLQLSYSLKGELTTNEIASALRDAQSLLQRTIYSYAPVNESGIAAHAKLPASSIHNVAQLASHVHALKPKALEESLLPFVKDDRDPEFLIRKKCEPAVLVAQCAYFRVLYENLFPPAPVTPKGTVSKNEFRFAAQLPKWTVVRKANLDIAENKEVFATLVATYEGVSRKAFEYAPDSPAPVSTIETFLSAYPPRKSLSRLSQMLTALLEKRVLDPLSEPARAYFIQRIFAQAGYPIYASIDVVNRVYPELKIPKPRGRLKKD